MNRIGMRLRKIRETLNMNQSEFAVKLGLSRSALGKYERDESFPSKKVLHILANQYNVSMDYLLCNRETVFYKTNTNSLDVQKYKMDKETEEMLFLMTHSLLVHHSVLSFLQRFKIDNHDVIEKQLTNKTEIKGMN